LVFIHAPSRRCHDRQNHLLEGETGTVFLFRDAPTFQTKHLPVAKEVFAFYSPCGILLNGNSGELPGFFFSQLFVAVLRRD
jgi:hypothetical protein